MFNDELDIQITLRIILIVAAVAEILLIQRKTQKDQNFEWNLFQFNLSK